MNLTLKPDMFKKHETKHDFQKKTLKVKEDFLSKRGSNQSKSLKKFSETGGTFFSNKRSQPDN
jgi:hypothetical protein